MKDVKLIEKNIWGAHFGDYIRHDVTGVWDRQTDRRTDGQSSKYKGIFAWDANLKQPKRQMT